MGVGHGRVGRDVSIDLGRLLESGRLNPIHRVCVSGRGGIAHRDVVRDLRVRGGPRQIGKWVAMSGLGKVGGVQPIQGVRIE